MKRTLALLATLALVTIATARDYAGTYSGYYEPTKCRSGYAASYGQFNFTVDSSGFIHGEFEIDPDGQLWVAFTGRVNRFGRVRFGPELRWEHVFASAKITKDNLVKGRWRSKLCRGTIAGSPDF